MKEMARRFQALHESGCFVLPNPWDVGSARLFASMGFRALASTSAGLSFSLGRPDTPTALAEEEVLQNLRALVSATDLPVQADYQTGYGDSAEAVYRSVARCLETGIAGLSIEDASGHREEPLFTREYALDRLRAARAAIDECDRPIVLTGRAECFLTGHDDPLRESVERLQLYAGVADCLYAPGLQTREQVTAVVNAVAPKPVNVLAANPSWMTVDSLQQLGVRRVSVGSALSRVAWNALMSATADIAQTGRFSSLSQATPFARLDELFGGNAQVN